MAYEIRIFVGLTKAQHRALIKLANRECRDPREQLRYILLKYLSDHPELDAENSTNEEGDHHD